jgi:hypothetical protein
MHQQKRMTREEEAMGGSKATTMKKRSTIILHQRPASVGNQQDWRMEGSSSCQKVVCTSTAAIHAVSGESSTEHAK